MSDEKQKYDSDPIIGWSWRDVDLWLGKWTVRIPMMAGAVVLVLTGRFYGFWVLPSATVVNGGGNALGSSVRSAVDGAKPVLDNLDQGTRTFGRQGADDSLQQQRR